MLPVKRLRLMKESDLWKRLSEHNSQKVRVGIFDIDGVLRGKMIHLDKLKKALEGGFGFCNVVFGWDSADVPYENSRVSGWHTGYPDAQARLDPTTLRFIPWEDGLPFVLGDFSTDTSGVASVCPRTLLQKITAQAEDLGYRPLFAGELEWFNFQETPQSWADKGYRDPQPLTPGMFGYSVLRASQQSEFFQALFDQLLTFGIPAEGLHTETGDGVYEACIIYDHVLEAADRMALFKTSVKEIAYQHGQMASFMAKWNPDLPGCSGHIHQSLWDRAGAQNLFYESNGPRGMSSLMEQYIAGQLYCLPHILPLYAPTVNSYKRLVAGSWAAVSASWGIENRTAALRVVPAGPNGTRLETRVPGADANPYLSMAAALASGLYGIRHQLKLDTPPTQGNEYENKGNPPLPGDLHKATQAMERSPVAEELFGTDFVDHFVRTREWEWQQFLKAITDWEMKRYFEII